MKKIVLLSTLSAALLASFGAHAADTTELKVKGVIRPSACTPSISGGGVVDYGTIASKSLSATAPTVLETKTVPFSITCDARTRIAVKAIDNQASTRVTGLATTVASHFGDVNMYGLGAVAGKNVGAYAIMLKQGSFTADNTNADTLYSRNNGTSWAKGSHGSFSTDAILSFAPAGTTTPIAYKDISGTLSVTAVIDKTTNLPALTQDIPLNGSATIEVVYL